MAEAAEIYSIKLFHIYLKLDAHKFKMDTAEWL